MASGVVCTTRHVAAFAMLCRTRRHRRTRTAAPPRLRRYRHPLMARTACCQRHLRLCSTAPRPRAHHAKARGVAVLAVLQCLQARVAGLRVYAQARRHRRQLLAPCMAGQDRLQKASSTQGVLCTPFRESCACGGQPGASMRRVARAPVHAHAQRCNMSLAAERSHHHCARAPPQPWRRGLRAHPPRRRVRAPRPRAAAAGCGPALARTARSRLRARAGRRRRRQHGARPRRSVTVSLISSSCRRAATARRAASQLCTSPPRPRLAT